MSTSVPDSGGADQPARSAQRLISLRQFLKEAAFVGARDIEVRRCAHRADRCQPGDVFVPTHSPSHDEADRADEAIRRGAVAVVCERLLPVSVPQCLVEDNREVYARLCHALSGSPSERMLTVGVVGSHGKTTAGLFIAAMLKRLAGAAAYYTSLGASDSTTCDRTATRAPGAAKLANWLERAERTGAPAAVIELTPAMLHNRIVAGVSLDLLVVTSLRPGQNTGSPTSQQLTGLIQELLASLKPHGVVLANGDDAGAATFVDSIEGPAAVYGLDAGKHVRGKRLGRYGGQQQVMAIAGNVMMPMTLQIPGDHIARGALAAVAASWIMDLPLTDAIGAVESLQLIPGRMQRLTQAVDVPVYIDHGQTPDRVAVALHALRSHHLGPATVVMDIGNQLATQFRQRLGEVLDKGAQRIVLSASDLSPEAAQRLSMDVLGGCRSPGRVHVIPDRQAAIVWAVRNTEQGCILLSGCGAGAWSSRDGQSLTDEMVAKQAVQQRNSLAATAQLSIYPPSSSTEFFSH
ncbi:MAG: hypothetical protein KF752_15720 [Pirellulaceae bacterium]|nr:hypothetical protein [Pirellulaceae bacterium]